MILNKKEYFFFAIIFISTLIYYMLIRQYGFSLADEGFLWYGAWQTSLGSTPIADFQSYDPFRYYWIANWFDFFNSHNISILRISIYLFGLFGLFGLLYILKQINKQHDYLYSVFTVLFFLLWIFPYWKIFEHVVSIMSIIVLYKLASNFSSNKWLIISGIYTSFLFFYGRNHALYMHIAVVSMFLIFYIWNHNFKFILKKVYIFTIGYMLGLIPTLYMIIFIDGYWHKIQEWLIWFISRGVTTNLHKPYVLPWHVSYANFNYFGISNILFSYFSLFMIIIFIFSIIVLFRLIIKKEKDYLLLASSLFVIVYFHYFSSRPDLGHLAQTIMPSFIFISILILRTRLFKYIFIILLISLSLIVTKNPIVVQYLYPGAYKKVNISGHVIYVGKKQKRELDFLNKYLGNKAENVFCIPNLISIYSMYSLKSPTYDLYYILSRGKAYQEGIINDLKINDIKLIILKKHKYDGREDMLFQHTYPIVYSYIKKNYIIKDKINNILIYEKIGTQ